MRWGRCCARFYNHHNAECVGIHAARHGTRFEALEPIRQGVRRHFGLFAKGIAAGLSIRHDHGSQYMSAVFQGEIAFLGAESSPAVGRRRASVRAEQNQATAESIDPDTGEITAA